VAVAGVPAVAELAFAARPFETIEGELEYLGEIERECDPLRQAGLSCDVRVVPSPPSRAVCDVAEVEEADLIVVAKRPHRAFVDTLLNDMATHIVHNPPCPVVVVPSGRMPHRTSPRDKTTRGRQV
jgi:nucleotide-binding universal stress UspA family protein